MDQLTEYLSQFVSADRKEKIEKVLSKRTNYLTVVLEDIYKSQNASAVLRTCECFGIQNIHIIESKHKYEINPDVTIGSDKWLNLHFYNSYENNTIECINQLKAKGYKIVGTTPHEQDNTIYDIEVNSSPLAIIFGSEKLGLSQDAINNCDYFLKIPMVGFSESFNISVSAAITIQHLLYRLKQLSKDIYFSKSELDSLRLKWYQNSIKKSKIIVEDFLNKIK
ncbi:MAG: hypothetical protein A2X12_10665 [Bacteroidetes bacterium GWE2_29_8]|nr:MAG: hypothetical protein A2X12_10665 [Bacteroidetes bacterium GWE2_29_8]OFY24844.1 MAG: hypothetical protein A2X02_03865 [Bacteroidetes bacterium GWF2_29_10]